MRPQDRALIDSVERFRHADDRSAERLNDEILRPYASSFERIAYFMRPSMQRYVEGDEVLGLCLQAAWQLLCSDGSNAMPDDIPSSAFIPMMRRQVAQLARKEFERSPRSGLSGTTAVMRRRNALDKQRAALWSTLGRMPTDDEVIDAHNEKMLATRTNAVRQGALASHADLVAPTVYAVEDDDLTRMAGTVDDESRSDLESVMHDIVTRCYEQSQVCGEVAAAMLSAVDTDSAKTAASLSRELDLAREVVQLAMRDVQNVTIEVMDEFALTVR